MIDLDCYYNQLATLDITLNIALNYFDCAINQLTNLDLSQNTALIALDCGENQLTNLDLSQNTALMGLHCNDNLLTNLELSQNIALTNLSCGNNQLANLELSQNIALTNLFCGNNQLTNLDVTSNIALTVLSCYYNLLTSLDMRNIDLIYFFYFDATSNPNLTCVSVDDPDNLDTEISDNVDTGVYFSTSCSTPVEEIGLGKSWALGDIYPNPSKNEILGIDYLSEENTEMNIQLIDMTGRLILEQQVTISTGSHNLELNYTRLKTGMYIIQFNTDKTSMTRKIMIQ